MIIQLYAYFLIVTQAVFNWKQNPKIVNNSILQLITSLFVGSKTSENNIDTFGTVLIGFKPEEREEKL